MARVNLSPHHGEFSKKLVADRALHPIALVPPRSDHGCCRRKRADWNDWRHNWSLWGKGTAWFVACSGLRASAQGRGVVMVFGSIVIRARMEEEGIAGVVEEGCGHSMGGGLWGAFLVRESRAEVLPGVEV